MNLLIWTVTFTISLATVSHQSTSFQPIRTVNGSKLCAVGQPSSTEIIGSIVGIPNGTPGAVAFSYRCTLLGTSGECLAFNHVSGGKTNAQCQYYRNPPSRHVANTSECVYYEIASSRFSSPNSPACSFPYTYNGNLYNKCITIGNTPIVDWYCASLDSKIIRCPIPVSAESYPNVALNREAYQVSTYSACNASQAVSNKPNIYGSCTDAFLQPWWAVDLGRPSNIIAVNVTNVNPAIPSRLNNFIVGLSNFQPTTGQKLQIDTNYTLCRQYNGSVADGAAVLMSCALGLPSFRYVIIQSSLSARNALCLRRVEVYLGFTDANTTVDVIVPVTMKKISLKSVNDWLVIMSRVDDNFTFNATWQTYKGFGNSPSNFWLGLENLYLLTSELFQTTRGHFYRLRFEVQAASSDRWYSEEYDWFYVDGESNGYALHVSAAGSGDAGDAINSPNQPANRVNEMRFYSHDKDNSDRCAATNGGGWWNNECNSSNIMGSTTRGFVWNELLDGPVSVNAAERSRLQAARMMMKSPV